MPQKCSDLIKFLFLCALHFTDGQIEAPGVGLTHLPQYWAVAAAAVEGGVEPATTAFPARGLGHWQPKSSPWHLGGDSRWRFRTSRKCASRNYKSQQPRRRVRVYAGGAAAIVRGRGEVVVPAVRSRDSGERAGSGSAWAGPTPALQRQLRFPGAFGSPNPRLRARGGAEPGWAGPLAPVRGRRTSAPLSRRPRAAGLNPEGNAGRTPR